MSENKKPVKTVTEEVTQNKIIEVLYKPGVRIIVWGGSGLKGNNNTFEHTKNTLKRSYEELAKKDKSKDPEKVPHKIIDEKINTADDIVNFVNSQDDNSIISLDIFSHGSTAAAHFNSAPDDASKDERQYEHNNSLYRTWGDRYDETASGLEWKKMTIPVINQDIPYPRRFRWGYLDGSALLTDMKFSRFRRNAKIELHGCNTAANYVEGRDKELDDIMHRQQRTKSVFFIPVESVPDPDDNFPAFFSRRLYMAGKTRAVVIAHSDTIHPGINDDKKKGIKTKPEDQDYRHGPRVVYYNGVVVHSRPLKSIQHIDIY